MLRDYVTGIYYGTNTKLHYRVILRDYIMRRYYRILLRNHITDLYYNNMRGSCLLSKGEGWA